jgi:hypothetical protein
MPDQINDAFMHPILRQICIQTKRQALEIASSIKLYLEDGDKTCVSTRSGAAGQTLKWRPFMEKFERHICLQSKLYGLL